MEKKYQKKFEDIQKAAKDILQNKKMTDDFLNQAQTKANLNNHSLKTAWKDLQLVIRLVKSWSNGKYTGISIKPIIITMAAIIYFVNPFDIVPDFIAGLGFMDDITILTFALSAIKDDIEKFRLWEEKTKDS